MELQLQAVTTSAALTTASPRLVVSHRKGQLNITVFRAQFTLLAPSYSLYVQVAPAVADYLHTSSVTAPAYQNQTLSNKNVVLVDVCMYII